MEGGKRQSNEASIFTTFISHHDFLVLTELVQCRERNAPSPLCFKCLVGMGRAESEQEATSAGSGTSRLKREGVYRKPVEAKLTGSAFSPGLWRV